MKKLLLHVNRSLSIGLLITALCVTAVTTQLSAQRYLTEQFTSVDVTSNITYGENYSVLTGSPILQNLVLDFYEPTGDTETDRPLIVVIPTGSFLPRYINQLPTGDKTDSATVEICNRYAKLGYAVACIEYRRGWNPQGTQDERTETIIQAVYRSMQDAKTAVRFFRKDHAENSNSYGIDPNKVIVVGQGSGGYTALAYAHINTLAEMQLTKFFNFTTNAFMIDTAIHGDWDGFGGNPALNHINHPGYSSDINVACNIGGAIGDSTWIHAGETPVVSFHGIFDAFAPYDYGIVNVPGTTLFVVDVSGSGGVQRVIDGFGNNDVFKTPAISDVWTTRANAVNTAYDAQFGNGGNEGLMAFEGQADGNGPWEFWDEATVTAGAQALGQDPQTILNNGYASNPVYQALGPVAGRARAVAFIDSMIGYSAPRFYRVLFEANSIDENDVNDQVSMYPNPTADFFYLGANAENPMLGIEIFDMAGKLIMRQDQMNATNYVISCADYPSGFYFVNVRFENGTATKKLVVR